MRHYSKTVQILLLKAKTFFAELNFIHVHRSTNMNQYNEGISEIELKMYYLQ